MIRIISPILIFFFTTLSSFGQTLKHDFPTLRWNENMGLKSKSVNDVDTDSRGIIWFGGQESIYRNDGNSITNINKIIENSPFDNPIEVYEIYIDKEDRMWIGTIHNGLMMYDIPTNEFQQFETLINGKDYLSNLRVYGLHTMNDSILRFCSHTHGLIDFNFKKDSYKVLEVFTDSVELERLDGFQLMMDPVIDVNDEVIPNWYTSLTGMVEYQEELDSFVYYDDGAHIRLRASVMDEDSIFWGVTYGQGLYRFDPKTKQFTNFRNGYTDDWEHPSLTGASIQINNDSTLILDSENGLYYFNKNRSSFYSFNEKITHGEWSWSTQRMKWINNELWFASWSSGLHRHFRDNHGVQSGNARYYIDEVHYDEYHDRFITVSYPDLITIHEDESYSEIIFSKPDQDNKVLEDLTVDFNGNLWVVTREKVFKYNPIKKDFEIYFGDLLEKIKTDLTFRKIAIHPDGNLWLSSHDGTIFTFNPTTLGYKFYGGLLAESIPLDYNYRAYFEGFTSDGFTWFSSQDGFFGLDPTDKAHKFCHVPLDRKTNVPITLISPEIGIGDNNKICFGTKTHEIYLIDMDSLNGGYADHIDISNAVPNISINDIEIDIDGNIWIATKLGLIKIDQMTSTIDLFGDAHRLYDLYEIELKNGKYPIVTTERFFRIIDPDKLKPFSGTPNIQLLNTEVDSRTMINPNSTYIKTGQAIKMKPEDNFLRFQFNDFNYVSKQPKTYAIKVEGLHDDWIDLKDRKEFGLSGLEGGLSKIWVKSKLQFAKEYSAPVHLLTVDVTPPLTQRKSFWALCAGALMLLFYLGYRFRLSQLKERQNLMIAFNKQLAETEMKALRAQMNPHFLFNVLNAIKLNVQKNQPESAIDFITDFSKLIRSVLQNSGKKRVTLEEELQTLELYIKIERKRFSTSFDYELKVDPDVNTSTITIPPMLLQPYVENAIWHGILHKTEGKGRIEISTYKKEKSIVIEITDNGIGREKANQLKLKSAQKNKSMGMQITRDRMAISNTLSNDQITVEIIDLYDKNRQPQGTKVIVTLDQTN